MANYDALLAEASQLPIGDRLQLIETLWDTVPPQSLPPLSDEWVAEIQRRSAEFDVGNAQVTSWEQIKADARQRSSNNPVPE
ncbi:addiction module protein [Anatilimnocola sp. NA78]|uniref:addiction module protein n=1 Tax=Anatilimnocola sp. NA78 TaxID=3415683 RepID=UPI003CE46DD2